MTDEELSALEKVAAATESEDDWAEGRNNLTWTPREQGRPARVWYDDGDLCAEVTHNLGLGLSDDRFAEFFATFSPKVVTELLAEVRRLRTAVGLAGAGSYAEVYAARQAIKEQMIADLARGDADAPTVVEG